MQAQLDQLYTNLQHFLFFIDNIRNKICHAKGEYKEDKHDNDRHEVIEVAVKLIWWVWESLH